MGDKLRPILDAYLAGGMPPNIALMRLCIEAGSREEVRGALASADTRLLRAKQGPGSLSQLGEGQREGGALPGYGGPSPHASPTRDGEPVAPPALEGAAERLAAVSRLLEQHPSAWATIRAVMAEAEHDHSTSSPEDAVAYWSSVFDRLAKERPEAGVALYTLGSRELLDAATVEIVDALRGWRLIDATTDVLDIGCGIGRFVDTLAPEVAHVMGLDVSREMIAAARARCAGLANVRLEVSSGRDLAGIDGGSIDLVLAVDVFPYLVQAGEDVARSHVAEAARVLRPGGTLAILNYSYRGDTDLDRREIATLAERSGFEVAEPRPGFRYWDGSVYLLERPP